MTIKEQLDQAAEIIGGRSWGLDKGKPRIYVPCGRKDVKVYFEFSDFCNDYLGGASLKIWVDECGQHRNWYLSERDKLRKDNMNKSLALSCLPDDEALAKEIMEKEEIKDFDLVASHIINGRFLEAKQLLEDKQ